MKESIYVFSKVCFGHCIYALGISHLLWLVCIDEISQLFNLLWLVCIDEISQLFDLFKKLLSKSPSHTYFYSSSFYFL